MISSASLVSHIGPSHPVVHADRTVWMFGPVEAIRYAADILLSYISAIALRVSMHANPSALNAKVAFSLMVVRDPLLIRCCTV